MFLNRIQLDQRCREARRDLSDPYQLHSTLCRAFSIPDTKCPEGEFLWRLEFETDLNDSPSVLVQSRAIPEWSRIGINGWLSKADPAIDLKKKLMFDAIQKGQRFRFRLRANPCVTRNGKRIGLMRTEEQENWIKRKGEQHGFILPRLVGFDFSEPVKERVDVRISQEKMVRGSQRSGNAISIFSVLYDGSLVVSEPEKFRNALKNGIGHGKVVGLGLLSAVPIAG